MLKGQAKKDFEKWLSDVFDLDENSIEVDCSYEGTVDVYVSEHFEILPFSMQYGVLVDWFDSVGIYVNVHAYEKQTYWMGVALCLINKKFDTRTQARQKAIEQANKIYNDRK
jgi:hypothetical protein